MRWTMFCLLDVLFVSVFLYYADPFVSSEENVTSREGLPTIRVSEPVEGDGPVTSPKPGNVSHAAELPQLAMEGGGTVLPVAKPSAAPVVVSPSTTGGERGVVSSAAPTVFPGAATVSPVLASSSTSMPSDLPGKVHTLNDEVKNTDIDKLLETSEGGSHTKNSSIVARKGAPPDAPVVAEGDDSTEVQSLFGDETKNGSASATSVCSNYTLQGNDNTNNNCSQNEYLEKSPVTYDITPPTSPTTVVAAGIRGNISEMLPGKQTGNVKISKPAVLHGHVVSASYNNSIRKLGTPQNNAHNSIVKKILKPATTTGIDESKEQLFPTDTPASKGDYIIPIIGIILAVPMVAILFMFFYKRSAEFWERRHYKRMDFLIDGMYND